MIEYILVILVVILSLLYYYITSTLDHWKIRGISGPKPTPFFGTTKDVFFGNISEGVYIKNVYEEYKSKPMVGIFDMQIPSLIINDPEMVKTVLVKDFSKFSDRSKSTFEKTDVLDAHLFKLDTERWKPLRSKLTPVFSSGKLKEMFHLLLNSGKHLRQHLVAIVDKGEPVECQQLMAQFTIDVIGSCAFGIETNSMEDEESEFCRVGKEIFNVNNKNLLKERVKHGLPKFFSIIGSLVVNKYLGQFFTRITKDAIEYRENHNFHRNDFIDILVKLKKSEGYSDGFLAAQTFVFFVAGFETSSSTMSMALYEMALNQDIQRKVREDMTKVLEKTNGEITYESIKEMNYFDRFCKEVLRKYPILMMLIRQSKEDYTFEGTNVKIPKDQRIYIPVLGFHHDPDIYPKPEVFDPDRFTDEMINFRNPMHYLPFGSGPRNCIGWRFALNQVKVGLINIILNYRVDVCEKTQIPIEIHPRYLMLSRPKNGVYLKFSKLESNN